jgi:malate dehydrogenase
VIKARGASSAASAANAVVQSVYHLVTDTPAGESFSVCRSSTGEYGVDEGLIFSFPMRRENGNLHVVEGLPFNEYSQMKFNDTLNELRHERDTVKALGLLD